MQQQAIEERISSSTGATDSLIHENRRRRETIAITMVTTIMLLGGSNDTCSYLNGVAGVGRAGYEFLTTSTEASNLFSCPSFSSNLEKGVYEGLQLAFVTMFLTVLLELTSLDTVRRLRLDPQNKDLYRIACFINVRNHLLFGVPVYATSIALFGKQNDAPAGGGEDVLAFSRLIQVMLVVLIHGLSYYTVHMAMHSHPSLYRFHKFHHRFNKYIPVMAANAVSVVEYLLAYVLPFGLAALLTSPVDELDMRAGVYIVSTCNLLIHTSALEKNKAIASWLEPYFVTAASHSTHHRQLNIYYAAPTLNFDWFFAQLFQRFSYPSALFSAKQGDDAAA